MPLPTWGGNHVFKIYTYIKGKVNQVFRVDNRKDLNQLLEYMQLEEIVHKWEESKDIQLPFENRKER